MHVMTELGNVCSIRGGRVRSPWQNRGMPAQHLPELEVSPRRDRWWVRLAATHLRLALGVWRGANGYVPRLRGP